MDKIKEILKFIYVGCKLSKGWAKIHKSEARIKRLEDNIIKERVKLINTISATQEMLDKYNNMKEG